MPSFFFCREGRGRPPLAVPEDWKLRCTRVGLTHCPEKGVDKPDYVYVEYDCGCLGFKQISSLRRRGDAALQCPDHGSGKRKVSALLRRVRAQLEKLCLDLGPVTLEARLLPGRKHAFDLWFVKWKIAVEVDGKQHFVGHCHGKAASAQYAADRKLDALCTRRKLRLLRMHYEDELQWGTLMQRAVQDVTQNPHCTFVRYTGSYSFEAARQ